MSDGTKVVLLVVSLLGNAVGVLMVYRHAFRRGYVQSDMDTINAIGRFLNAYSATRSRSDEWLRGYCEAAKDVREALKAGSARR